MENLEQKNKETSEIERIIDESPFCQGLIEIWGYDLAECLDDNIDEDN